MLKGSLKKAISIVLVIGTMFTFAACGSKNNASNGGSNSSQSEEMQKIKKSGKLVLGTSADFPPYEFHKSVNGTDQIVGFDIEIAKQIAKDLGVQLEIKDMKFDGLIAALDEGNVDMVISGMTPTEERKKKVDFSDIYYRSAQDIIVRASDKDKVKSTNDLNGKKIGVQKGAIQEQIAQKQVSGAQPMALGTIPDIILALKSNRVDAAIVEAAVANANVSANKDLAVADIKLKTDEDGSAIAMKKGSTDLVKAVNKTLSKLKANKSIDKFVVDATNSVDLK